MLDRLVRVKLVHWPLMGDVPITVLLYSGPLLCGVNVPIND